MFGGDSRVRVVKKLCENVQDIEIHLDARLAKLVQFSKFGKFKGGRKQSRNIGETVLP
jgi:hypothetical protein